MLSNTGYEAYMILDDRGRKTFHYAKSEDEALQAYLTHFGINECSRSALKIMSLVSFNGVVCQDLACLNSVNMPLDVRRNL